MVWARRELPIISIHILATQESRSPAGGPYVPSSGMYAAIRRRGPCRDCRMFADLTRRYLRHPADGSVKRVAKERPSHSMSSGPVLLLILARSPRRSEEHTPELQSHS